MPIEHICNPKSNLGVWNAASEIRNSASGNQNPNNGPGIQLVDPYRAKFGIQINVWGNITANSQMKETFLFNLWYQVF